MDKKFNSQLLRIEQNINIMNSEKMILQVKVVRKHI
jgi:hypothetical protein